METVAVIPGIESVAELLEPLKRLPWGSLRQFWLSDILVGRNSVLIFAALLPLLLAARLFSAQHLRLAIVITGLVFAGYVFGLAYLVFWVLSCLAFYRLSEQFAIEVRRTDVYPWAPPLAAGAILVGYFVFAHVIDNVRLSAATNRWLLENAAILWPLGARGFDWEPNWFLRRGTPQFFYLIFHRSHEVGTAYLVMRMLHYFSEIKRGSILPQQRSLLHFLAYVCYVPTLIQGPIERYQEFQSEVENCCRRWRLRDLLVGIWRIGLGVGKWGFTLAYFLPWVNRLGLAKRSFIEHPERTGSYLLLFFSIHLTVFLLYLLFSAYCDIAIGISRLAGIRLVENFRRPFIARSLTDMWRRWHISLSFILRDYIYFPLIRRRWNPWAAAVASFLICGLWHELQTGYALWGIVMGLMVAVNQHWTRLMRDLQRRPGHFLAKLQRFWRKLHPLPWVCSWLLAQNAFVLSGWVCFWGLRGFVVLGEIFWRPIRLLLGL